MKTRNSCPLAPGSHVWSYLRVSGDEQADRGLPIAGQREAHQAYADQHGLVITQWYVDEARPGGTTAHRDAFNEMIYQARKDPRQADGILLWDLSRFARNQLDSQFYKADLRRRGWQLIFLADDIPETDFAPVYEALLEWKAEKDREVIATNAQRGLQSLARKGYAPGGFPPQGYLADELTIEMEGKRRKVRRWVPDPEWWHVARRAWELRAQGASYVQIMKACPGLYKTRGCLTTFFANKTYLGVRKCGDLEVPDAHTPLIDQELWDAVQARRRRVTREAKWRTHPRRVHSSFLLSGLLYCAECGAAMIGSSQGGRVASDGYRRARWRFYICGRKKNEHWDSCPTSKLKADKVEKAVLDTLIHDVFTPENMTGILEATNEALSGRLADLTSRQETLQLQITRVDARICRLLDALEAGDSASVRARLAEREDERDAILGELAAIDQFVQQSRLEISPAALRALIENLHAVFLDTSIEKARAALRTVIRRIEVSKRGGVIYYTLPFQPGPLGL